MMKRFASSSDRLHRVGKAHIALHRIGKVEKFFASNI